MAVAAFLLNTNRIGFGQKTDSISHKAPATLLRKETNADSVTRKDSSVHKKYDPGRASLYSAIFPGLGQFYNKKYWKVPIVWAAVGIPAYTFFDNRKWYAKTRYALAVVANGSQGNADSLNKVDALFRDAVLAGDSRDLQNERDYFRKNEDYSVLFFLLFYALSIVDATVDAHLKEFNVSSDLSFHIKPAILEGSNAPGMTLTFDFHKARPKPVFDIR